ncbi:cytochrome b5-like heme/steroid binding domain-containing protein [Aspergillus recurvatus]
MSVDSIPHNAALRRSFSPMFLSLVTSGLLLRDYITMGWLTLRRRANTHNPNTGTIPVTASVSASEKTGAYSEHAEDIPVESPTNAQQQPQVEVPSSSFLGQSYVFHPTTPDSDLPYIDSSILSLVGQHWNKATSTTHSFSTASQASALEQPPAWIVIDNIVYDCTSFQHSHPGGPAVICSFVGQDCSWQFWRFHGEEHMRNFARPLRIGRTSGIRNRFTEPPRYVGLSSALGDTEW